MDKVKARLQTNSLTFRFGFSVTILTCVMLLVIGLSALYNFRLIARNIADTMSYSGRLYAASIQSSLRSITSGVQELTSFVSSNSKVAGASALDTYLHDQSTFLAVQDRQSFVQATDIYYVYDPDSDKLLMSLNSRLPMGSSYLMSGFLREAECSRRGEWHMEEIGGDVWLTLYYETGGSRIGALVRLQTLMQDILGDGLVPDIEYAIADRDGTLLYTVNEELIPVGSSILTAASSHNILGSLLVTQIPLDDYDGSLCLIRSEQSVYEDLFRSFWIICLFSLVGLAMFSFYLQRTRRNIVTPVTELTEGMRQMERGNWDCRLPENSSILEFQTLSRGFNSMIDEVHTLKIEAYEAELERSREQLRALRMQLRPHFYLNAITTISSLLYKERISDAQTFINSLSEYLRYLFSKTDVLPCLSDEIEYCRRFIQLQQIKYPDRVFYMVEITPPAGQSAVPKFMIQTLVENIFKHGFSPESYLSIFIEASPGEFDGMRGVRISVEDNGCGFPQDVLAGFPCALSADHVGLENLEHTLRLMYGRDGLMRLSNSESGGARIDIFLPEKGGEAE